MQAIVLSRRPFRDYDERITLFTEEFGKVSVIARGNKRVVSKQSAHSEPFSFITAEIIPGKELGYLTKAQSLDSFFSIRKDLKKSLAAWYVVSLTEQLLESQAPDIRLFRAILSWLQFVGTAPSVSTFLLDGYSLMILNCLGVSPVLDRCVVCSKSFFQIGRQELQADYKLRDKPGFYFSGGGLICGACRQTKKAIGEHIALCGLKEISDMKMLLKNDWSAISQFPLSKAEQHRAHVLVHEYLEFHSEKKIVDWTSLLKL